MTEANDALGGLDATLGATRAEFNALKAAADDFGSVLSSGLKAAIVQGKSLDDVLKSMALRLSAKALETALDPFVDKLQEVVSSLAGSLGSGLSGLIGSLLPFAKGGVVPFASGGVVAAPTYFPMSGGDVGVAGEAGAEAILPLARGADGRLGVRGEGGGVAVTFNVTAPEVESFRRSEAQLTAMLARAVGRGRRGL